MYNFKRDIYHFKLSSGMFTVALIVWMLFFVFARIIYSKFDKNYNRKKENTAYLTKEKK
ncbi:hypothetical protein O0F59_06670 [Staphylococcus pseudintermedius]|nr:hypothetical protein [Staphylococcus pseudintermedius]